MKYFALSYEVVENFAERRMPFREPHLKMVRDAHERGDIVMAGARGDPANVEADMSSPHSEQTD